MNLPVLDLILILFMFEILNFILVPDPQNAPRGVSGFVMEPKKIKSVG